MATPSPPSARTPLYHWHLARGARLGGSDGWLIPEAYACAEDEVRAVREGLALVDLSAFTKISLQGGGVAGLTQALLGDSPAGKPLGVDQLKAGGPVLACRLTAQHLLLVSETTTARPLEEHLANLRPEPPVTQTDVTSALAGFHLVGPRAQDVLARLTALDVSPAALPAGSCAETGVAGVPALLVHPPGKLRPVIHLYVAWDLGEYLWVTLLETGRTEGITPVGGEAWRGVMHT